MKRIMVLAVVFLFSTQALAIRVVDVQEGMEELNQVDKTISALGCMWNKGVFGSSHISVNYRDYMIVGSPSSDDCDCGVKCRAILSEIGFDKALNKLGEKLQKKRNSIKIGE